MSLIRKCITSSKLPKPIAPYSQAVVADRTVYVSGCLGVDATTNKLVSGGVAAEAKKALENLGVVLEAADSGYDRVVKVTVFLNDINDFGAVGEEYKKSMWAVEWNSYYGHHCLTLSKYLFAVFVENPPARSCFAVGKLPANALVEIEAIAMTGDVKTVAVQV